MTRGTPWLQGWRTGGVTDVTPGMDSSSRDGSRTVRDALERKATAAFVARARAAMVVVMASATSLTAVDLLLGRSPTAPDVLARLLQLALVAVGFRLVSPGCPRARAIAIAVALSGVVCWTSAVATIVRGQLATGFLLFMVHVMGTATLLPWGAPAQAVSTALGAVALVLSVVLLPPIPSLADHAVVAAVAATTSVYVAYTLERSRRATVRGEAVMRTSEARQRWIIDAALEAIATVDAHGRVVKMNHAARQIFGLAPDGERNLALHELVLVPELANPCWPVVRDVGGVPFDVRIETRGRRTDGSTFPLMIVLRPLRIESRAVVTAYMRDLTERDEAAEGRTATAMVGVSRELMSLLDSDRVLATTAALAVDVLKVDGAAILMAPATVAAAVGDVADALDVTADAVAALAARVGNAGDAALVDVAVDAHAGRLLRPGRTTEALAAGLWSGTTASALLVVLRHDAVGFGEETRALMAGLAQIASMALTNARLVEEVAHASRVKSEFLSTMSHELRTPLNAIIGYAEMADDGELPPEERRDLAGRVGRAGRELLELIDSTLEIGRLESGQSDAHLETFDFAALWEQLRERAVSQRRAPGVALEWTEAPDASVLTDPRKLRAIVRNLVGNALKFTEQGSVRASARIDGDTLVVEVADTGIGIAPEDHERVFEMFRQADGSETRRYGGSGLGLYIVKRFAEQLGGRITLHSARGRGSTFTLLLPSRATSSLTAVA